MLRDPPPVGAGVDATAVLPTEGQDDIPQLDPVTVDEFDLLGRSTVDDTAIRGPRVDIQELAIGCPLHLPVSPGHTGIVQPDVAVLTAADHGCLGIERVLTITA